MAFTKSYLSAHKQHAVESDIPDKMKNDVFNSWANYEKYKESIKCIEKPAMELNSTQSNSHETSSSSASLSSTSADLNTQCTSFDKSIAQSMKRKQIQIMDFFTKKAKSA